MTDEPFPENLEVSFPLPQDTTKKLITLLFSQTVFSHLTEILNEWSTYSQIICCVNQFIISEIGSQTHDSIQKAKASPDSRYMLGAKFMPLIKCPISQRRR